MVIYRKVHGMYISPIDLYVIPKQDCESTFNSTFSFPKLFQIPRPWSSTVALSSNPSIQENESEGSP